MLCKTTMRAASAPVIAFVGLLGAAMASAQAIPVDISRGDTGSGGPIKFALETLTKDDVTAAPTEAFHVKVASSSDNVADGDFDTWLEVDITSDIILTRRADEHYYIRFDLQNGMVFAATPPQPLIKIPYSWTWDHDSDGGTTPDRVTASSTAMIVVDPEHNTYDSNNRGDDATGFQNIPVGDVDARDGAVAFGGQENQSSVIFRLPRDPIPDSITVNPSDAAGDNTLTNTTSATAQEDYPVGTTFSLRLPVHLAVPGEVGVYRVSASGYEDLSEARRYTSDTHGGAALFATDMMGGVGVLEIVSAVGAPSVEGEVVTADVHTPVANGGPFRRFLGGATTANLAEVTLNVSAMPGNHAREDYNATAVTVGEILSGAEVMVMAEMGAFAVGDFKIGTCASDDMTLGPADDMMMAPDAADATQASGSATGTSMTFCIDVGAMNTDIIPEVGSPTMPDGYMMTVTPMLMNDMAPDSAAPTASAAMNAGSIDHNGTTVHISFLSDSANYNQRLVIVNRGSDDVVFLMEDFQAEPLKTVEEQAGSDLTCGGTSAMIMGIRGTVPGNSRCVLRVQDRINVVTEAGADPSQLSPRTAGTLVVAAPQSNIDVMTVQVIPGTRELDTTVYPND